MWFSFSRYVLVRIFGAIYFLSSYSVFFTFPDYRNDEISSVHKIWVSSWQSLAWNCRSWYVGSHFYLFETKSNNLSGNLRCILMQQSYAKNYLLFAAAAAASQVLLPLTVIHALTYSTWPHNGCQIHFIFQMEFPTLSLISLSSLSPLLLLTLIKCHACSHIPKK